MNSIYLPLILLEIFYFSVVECDVDCLINEDKGYSDPKNIYQCKNELKCCLEYAKPSCCGSKPALQILSEQLSIWCTLFGILFMIALIVYCRKKDLHFFQSSKTKRLLKSCCCGGESEQKRAEKRMIISSNEEVSRV